MIPELEKDLELSFSDKIALVYQITEETLDKCKNPVVLFGGGVHSCIMLYFVRKVKPDIKVLFANHHFFFPELVDFVRALAKKEKINFYEESSNLTIEEFVKEHGFPFFKTIRNIIKKSDYEKYRITEGCRGMYRKLQGEFFKKNQVDCAFVGLCMGDASPIRKANWLRFGYIHRRPDGILMSKPIMHLTEPDCMRALKEFNISHHEPLMSNYYGSNTCYFCAEGMFDTDEMTKQQFTREYETREGGNLGWVYRNRKRFFDKIMYELGGADVLTRIANDTQNEDLIKWIQKYLK